MVSAAGFTAHTQIDGLLELLNNFKCDCVKAARQLREPSEGRQTQQKVSANFPAHRLATLRFA